jgi:hypothetical protein
MCIIIIKKAGIKTPSRKTLKRCFDANPDGAGIAYYNKGDKGCTISKGFMDWVDFCAAVESMPITQDTTAIYHFRIATHGSVTPEKCHPFPVSNKLADLDAILINTPVAMAHNGILRQHAPSNGVNMSDTQIFCQTILSQPVIMDNLDNPTIQALLESHVSGSRVVIMRPQLVMLGDWIAESNGLLFSNSSYKREQWDSWPSAWTYDKPRKAISTPPVPRAMFANHDCDFCGIVDDLQYSNEVEGWICKQCKDNYQVEDVFKDNRRPKS